MPDFTGVVGAAALASVLILARGNGHLACCGVEPQSLLDCVSSFDVSGGIEAKPPIKILVVTAVSPEVGHYGKYSAAVNGAWAKRFGHAFTFDRRHLQDFGTTVQRFSKNVMLAATRDALKTAPTDVDWILRMDCDAVLSNFQEDLISKLIADVSPEIQVIASSANQGVKMVSLVNFGVILFRNSVYVERLLDEMWTNNYLTSGGVDQDLFTMMQKKKFMDLDRTVVTLHETALNSQQVAITANAKDQPVYHLWSHADEVRTAVFRGAYRQLCGQEDHLDLNQTYLDALEKSASGASMSETQSGISQGAGAQARSTWLFAHTLMHWGNHSAAEEWLRRGLDGTAMWDGGSGYKSSAWDRYATQYARKDLSNILEKQGRFAEAAIFQSDMMHVCEDVDMREGREVIQEACISWQASFGMLLNEKRRFAEADVHLAAALSSSRKVFGGGGIQTARATKSLAVALRERGTATDETVLLLQSAGAIAQHQGATFEEPVYFQAETGLLLQSLGRRQEATQEFTAVLAAFGKIQTLRWLTLQEPRALLRALAVATESPHGGQQGLMLLEAVAEEVTKTGSREAGGWQARLGEALERVGRLGEAEARLEKALELTRPSMKTHEINALELSLARLRW